MDNTDILHAGRMTVEVLADRLSDVVDTAATAAAAVSPEWSVRDATAHLIGITGLYAELASGSASSIAEFTPAAVAEFNAKRLADIGETQPRALARALRASVGQFLNATADRPAETAIHWHAGIRVDLSQLTGILVAEYVLHGYDITAATDVGWPISPEHAALSLYGRGAVLDRVADPVASRGHTASYLLDLGGAGRLTARFTDGAITVDALDDKPVDCEISTDPVTMLLVSSGRLTQWLAIALGLLRATGTRPELAPAFFRLMYVF